MLVIKEDIVLTNPGDVLELLARRVLKRIIEEKKEKEWQVASI